MKCKFCADGRFFMQVGEQLLLERWVSKSFFSCKKKRKRNNARREHGSGVHDDDDVDFFFQRHPSVGRIDDISSQNIERIGIVVNIVNVNEKIYEDVDNQCRRRRRHKRGKFCFCLFTVDSIIKIIIIKIGGRKESFRRQRRLCR